MSDSTASLPAVRLAGRNVRSALSLVGRAATRHRHSGGSLPSGLRQVCARHLQDMHPDRVPTRVQNGGRRDREVSGACRIEHGAPGSACDIGWSLWYRCMHDGFRPHTDEPIGGSCHNSTVQQRPQIFSIWVTRGRFQLAAACPPRAGISIHCRYCRPGNAVNTHTFQTFLSRPALRAYEVEKSNSPACGQSLAGPSRSCMC